MRAILADRFGGPEVLTLAEVPAPEPGPGEVRVAVRASGVNPVDTYVRAGHYGRLPELPYIPGGDGAGVVDRIGPGVDRWAVGDRVYVAGALDGVVSGSMAEKVVRRADRVFALPDGVSFEQGAALGVPYGTAYRALFLRARVEAADSILIHGASGAVGLAALQLCVAQGLEVAGTAGSEEGCELLVAQGVKTVANHRAEGYLDRLKVATDGRGFDVILEMNAHLNLAVDLDLLALRGRVVVIGSRGTLDFDPRAIMAKEAAVLGLALATSTAEEADAIHHGLGQHLAQGTLDPLVGARYTFEEASTAHRAVEEGRGYGKVVVCP